MNRFIEVVMVVVVVTGADKPNITYQEPMPDMKTCFEEAARFSDHKLPAFVGADGLKITCGGKLAKEHAS